MVLAPAGSAEKPLLSSAVAGNSAATNREVRRSRLRILRLLEVTETRRASGVAWNAGNRQLHARREAVGQFAAVGHQCPDGCRRQPTGISKGVLLSPRRSV